MGVPQPEREEQHARRVVGDEDEHDGVDDGVVGGLADAGGAAGGVQAEVAGDQADGGAEHQALAEADVEVDHRDLAVQVDHEGAVVDAADRDGEEPAADDAEDRRQHV
jgi:hypothetical protein